MATEVHVFGLGGPACVVAAEPSWAVRELKTAVETTTDVLGREQRLLTGDVEHLDRKILKDICEGPLLELNCIRRPPEQAQWLEIVAADPDGAFLADAPLEIQDYYT